MLSYIKGVRNERVFYYFEQISKIPRSSRNEKEIADYIENIARNSGFKYRRDSVNNIIVFKNATQGRENEKPIMLQAHTDMVAEKNMATVHDFLKDPIELVQQGNILRANGTTLGADDGFGVALMLSVLTSNDISHPKLECLFTSGEEIGLEGAGAFDFSDVESRRMVNLDSAEENTVIIGCCGGVRTEMTIPVNEEKISAKGIKITIGGLCGGHSGEDIDRGRLNAHILMGKLLEYIKEKIQFNLSYISGGDKDNAIPRECVSVIIPENMESAMKALEGLNEAARSYLKAQEDNDLFVNCEITDTDSQISRNDTEKVLKVLKIRNGVMYYRSEPPILPETSRNLARIRTEGGYVKIGFSSRSYLEHRLEESINELDALAKEIGADTYHHERYPGWASPKDSELVLSWQSAYERVSGRKTEPTLIHAGLECGLISAALEGLFAISVGCNVHDLHTPKETMELDSLDRIYDTLIEFLKK